MIINAYEDTDSMRHLIKFYIVLNSEMKICIIELGDRNCIGMQNYMLYENLYRVVKISVTDSNKQ